MKIKKAPIKFVPYLKSVIWGGEKICRFKRIPQSAPKIGESWDISGVAGHISVVAEGDYKGLSLTDLIDSFGAELLGGEVMERYEGKFPLLIKLIDARSDLSVQVHPDDALAMQRHGDWGKTEMWYIIESENNAKIYSGLNREITPEEYERMVGDGSFSTVLSVHDSQPGDVFFIPAGRVHAIGAGNLLAEIQESSDITYRIYDYDRRDADGNPRELHTELAKDAIDYTCRDDYKTTAGDSDMPDEEIAVCDHFSVRRLLVDGEMNLDLGFDSFTVLMCLDGEVTLRCEEGSITVSAGHTVLLPAAVASAELKGKATVLLSRSAPNT